MGLANLFNYKKKKFTLIDVASDEVAMVAFAFFVAKYWTAVTSLAWYWYVIVFVVFLIKPLMAMIKK
ncbi:hypothetical protein HOL21_02105 [Candidatus Woesearchaeota archaeon]|jgi:hypothetical protein|nr:hypothetical protein [Candidatus Woesearchaeota archaeon]MBT5396984.1 hypothetical protein [Candidatus Woesearchaeota archaeon]MBT6367470.1 hypothetical protein [Candidatus Woesearchaeota archaeon]MBT7762384.1 hypothetical protein [Candidatus Woesearchaeota archaeon]